MAGRPQTDDFWRDQVRQISARDRRLGPGPIAANLAQIEKSGRVPPHVGLAPSTRTVARILAQFKAESKEIQQSYEEVYWPETFEQGLLPWEAAPAFLELLRFYNDPDSDMRVTKYWSTLWPARQPRPDLKTTLWFYRVTVSGSDRPVYERLTSALGLAQGSGSNRVVEYQLAGVPFSRVKEFESFNKLMLGMSRKEIMEKAKEDMATLFPGLAPSMNDALIEAILGVNPPTGEAMTEEAVAERLRERMRLRGGIEVWDENREELKGLSEDERFRLSARQFIAQMKSFKGEEM